jgi:transcriptional regulator EpsA
MNNPVPLEMLSSLSPIELERLLITIESAQQVYRRYQYFLWSQGALQSFLPHEIFAVGYGRYGTPEFRCEIISRSDLDSNETAKRAVEQLVRELADAWHGGGRVPLQFGTDDAAGPLGQSLVAHGLAPAMAHGVREFLGDTSGFFAFLRMPEAPGRRHAYHAEILLPHLYLALHRTLTAERASNDRRRRYAVNLSRREIEVVACIRDGKTNQQIAAELELSPLTVKNHVQNILRKLDVSNRAQAVAKAVKARLIPHLSGN